MNYTLIKRRLTTHLKHKLQGKKICCASRPGGWGERPHPGSVSLLGEAACVPAPVTTPALPYRVILSSREVTALSCRNREGSHPSLNLPTPTSPVLLISWTPSSWGMSPGDTGQNKTGEFPTRKRWPETGRQGLWGSRLGFWKGGSAGLNHQVVQQKALGWL